MKDYSDKFYTIVAAVSSGGVIGCDGRLPWHMPAELRHFKAVTKGKVIIVGRDTYESLPDVALEGRTYVVVTRQEYYDTRRLQDWAAPSILEAAKYAARVSPSSEIIIAGGGQIFAFTANFADRAIISTINAEVEGDTHFEVDLKSWKLKAFDRIHCEASNLTAEVSHIERPADRRLTPCVGVCSSTALGDPICKGCRRTSYDVDHWNLMPKMVRRMIMRELFLDAGNKSGGRNDRT